MEIPVLIELIPGRGFRARGGEPFALSAEGPTPDDALQTLRGLIDVRLRAGARLVPLEVPSPSNPSAEDPWSKGAGMFRDDPLFEEWQAAIAKRREGPDSAVGKM
jgi:hypothetical protein